MPHQLQASQTKLIEDFCSYRILYAAYFLVLCLRVQASRIASRLDDQFSIIRLGMFDPGTAGKLDCLPVELHAGRWSGHHAVLQAFLIACMQDGARACRACGIRICTQELKYLIYNIMMNKNKKPLLIAFSTQKGGVGKSTFTTLVASIMHYRLGYHIAVFDCDFPQYSLMQMRERDLKAVMGSDYLKKLAYEQFTTISKKAYPIMQSRADQIEAAIAHYLNETAVPPDIFFLDLPGTVNTPGILSALAQVDYIFSPITADRVVLESTLAFTDVLKNVLMEKQMTKIKAIHLFWNQVDGREKSALYTDYEKVIGELGLNLMQCYITDSKRFRKESEAVIKSIFRSTLLPADPKQMAACRLDQFMDEFLKIIKS